MPLSTSGRLALAGLKRGARHSKGAILVFELFEAVNDSDSIIEGPASPLV